jgi:nucleotide-binding universal stress UspA family protein
MIDHMMVPLDGSELAERALPCAERLAAATGAEVHLVRVVEPVWTAPLAAAQMTAAGAGVAWPAVYTPDPGGEEAWAAATQAADEYLATQRERLAMSTGGTVYADRLVGNTAAALLDYERTAGIDLIVMCSHGRSGLARFAVGSIADRLLRDGMAPLLLVRAFGDPVHLEQAVLCLDGSERAEAALDLVARLAPAVAREVTLLQVIERAGQGPEAERYLETAARRLPQETLTCDSRVEVGDPSERILDVAGPNKLVVMVTHGRSGLLRWALGSGADCVAHGHPAGLLLLRAGRA